MTFLHICAKRGGNSIQISQGVRPGLAVPVLMLYPFCSVGTPVFIIGEVAGLKITVLCFDELIYSGISSHMGKHCARTEEWAVQAPG